MAYLSNGIKEIVSNIDDTYIDNLSLDDIAKLREIFCLFMDVIGKAAQMKADGTFEHLSLDDFQRAGQVAASLWNVDVDRQQAMQITQKSESAFSSKICRSGIKAKKIHTYKYNDMLDIKNKVR